VFEGEVVHRHPGSGFCWDAILLSLSLTK
jgi:hypothetical protein